MKRLSIGDEASFSKTITEADVLAFAELSGDFNPLHIDENVAKNGVFKSRVCHGMLVASLISTVLGMYLPGAGTIYLEQNTKFVAPVYIGDTVTASAIIKEIKNRIVRLETTVIKENGDTVVEGEAVVMVEKNRDQED